MSVHNMHMFMLLDHSRDRLHIISVPSSGVRENWLFLLALPIIISVPVNQKVSTNGLVWVGKQHSTSIWCPSYSCLSPSLAAANQRGSILTISWGASFLIVPSQACNKEALAMLCFAMIYINASFPFFSLLVQFILWNY